MTFERHLITGMTDYTGVSLDDILSHLREWLSNTEKTIDSLRHYLFKTEEQRSLLENPKAVISFLKHFIDLFIDLFSRYKGDLERLVKEIPSGVTAARLEIVDQLYKSSLHEEGLTIQFKQDWVYKPLPHEEARPLLDNIYGDTRDMLVDYRDLSNLVPRLRTFVGSKTSSFEALSDLHLKPNVFGIGLNLNRILGRIRDWWQRRS